MQRKTQMWSSTLKTHMAIFKAFPSLVFIPPSFIMFNNRDNI